MNVKKNLFGNLKFKLIFPPLILCIASSSVFAGTDTTTLNVTANIGGGAGGSCTILMDTLSFGTYSGVELSASVSGIINCGGDPTMSWHLETDNAASRNMTGLATGQTLSYQLYWDPNHTVIADGSTTSATGSGDGTGTLMFGVIPAGQASSADTYSDTVSISIIF